MDTKKFKKIFGAVAVENGFKKVPGGWYKESDECLVILNLQKSSYSNLYYLNIKTYVHGTFEERYTPSKYWVVNYPGSILSRNPQEYKDLLDLENSITQEDRVRGLVSFFVDFLNDYCKSLLSIEGLWLLEKEDKVHLGDNLKKKLNKLQRTENVFEVNS